jgi:hypothetical protein
MYPTFVAAQLLGKASDHGQALGLAITCRVNGGKGPFGPVLTDDRSMWWSGDHRGGRHCTVRPLGS